MIASVLLHSLIALLLLRHAIQWAEGGGGASDPRGGGGGGTDAVARYVQLPASPATTPAAPVTPVAVPATPVPVPEPVQPEVIPPDEPVTPQAAAVAESSSASGAGVDGGGVGPGTGGGVGTGTGAGVGNDSGPGRGGDGAYITPPSVRTLIIPADCARGRFTVRFWVQADGRVAQVSVDPPPKRGGCRREMQDKMMDYRFLPARTRDGQAVASIYQVQLTH
jgi:hypothetical protein